MSILVYIKFTESEVENVVSLAKLRKREEKVRLFRTSLRLTPLCWEKRKNVTMKTQE